MPLNLIEQKKKETEKKNLINTFPYFLFVFLFLFFRVSGVFSLFSLHSAPIVAAIQQQQQAQMMIISKGLATIANPAPNTATASTKAAIAGNAIHAKSTAIIQRHIF
jgi:hypothetical protein